MISLACPPTPFIFYFGPWSGAKRPFIPFKPSAVHPHPWKGPALRHLPRSPGAV